MSVLRGKLAALAALLYLLMAVPMATAQQKVITVCAEGCDYTSIQAAVDSNPKASMIQVKAGTYKESLSITKDLNAQNLNLLGEGLDKTILQGGVSIVAATVLSVSGFTIEGQGAQVVDSKAVTFFNDSFIEGIGDGLSITNSESVTIQSNLFKANRGSGVMVRLGAKAVILANEISSNSGDGITLEGSQAIVADNNIQNNSRCGLRADSTSQLVGGGNKAEGNGGGDSCGNVPEGILIPSSLPAIPAICTATLTPNSSIQEAITDAPAGAVICLTAGTFPEALLISGNKSLTLRGAGREQTRLMKDWDTGITVKGNAVVTIESMAIIGFSCAMVSVQEFAQVTLRKTQLTVNGGICPLVEVTDVAQLTLLNSELFDSEGDALDVNSSKAAVHLVENTFTRNKDYAIYIGSRDPATIVECLRNTFGENGGGISNSSTVVQKCSDLQQNSSPVVRP